VITKNRARYQYLPTEKKDKKRIRPGLAFDIIEALLQWKGDATL
jgi:hypothetical protein